MQEKRFEPTSLDIGAYSLTAVATVGFTLGTLVFERYKTVGTLILGAATIAALIACFLYWRSKRLHTPTKDEPILNRLIAEAESQPLSQVFPKVISFAKQEALPELLHWAVLETNGYSTENGMREHERVPEYRRITGQHYDEHMRPLIIKDSRWSFLNESCLRQGVRELESLATSSTAYLYMIDPDANQLMREHLGVEVLQLGFPVSQVEGILARIRSRLLMLLHDIGRQSKQSA